MPAQWCSENVKLISLTKNKICKLKFKSDLMRTMNSQIFLNKVTLNYINSLSHAKASALFNIHTYILRHKHTHTVAFLVIILLDKVQSPKTHCATGLLSMCNCKCMYVCVCLGLLLMERNSQGCCCCCWHCHTANGGISAAVSFFVHMQEKQLKQQQTAKTIENARLALASQLSSTS